MINVNQITSTLAKLPDQALQQYAAMHKNDPYIMALAVAESNRRKEMRNAAQAPQGGMEPPKVADQEIAAMAPAPAQALPEEAGIARLPAGEMEFAGGGIVAFADGGDVERYQYGGSTFSPEFGLADPTAMDMDELRRQDILRQRREAEAAAQMEFLRRSAPEVAARLQPPAPTLPTAPAATAAPTGKTAATPAATTGIAAAVKPPRAPSASAAPAAAPAPAAAGIPDVAGLFDAALKKAGEQPTPFAREIKELGEGRTALAEEKVKGLEAIQKQFADIYKGRRDRLDTREAELGKLKDQGLGLALLQAGAAMMSTPGSLGKAVGKGVQVGSERYAAGLEKLQSAKEKLADARDRLEEIEAQRGELSAREIFTARIDAKNVALSGKEDLIKAHMQAYGVNRATAEKQIDAQIRVGISQFEQAQQTKRTQLEIAGRERAANAPSAQERIARALGGGSLEKGLIRMAEIQAGKFDPRKAYSDYLIAAQKMPGTDVMSYAQFIGQLTIPTVPGANPATAAPGTVRERP